MAGYREHISVSGLCGVIYGSGAALLVGFTPVQGAIAGCLTWVAGMLPDLDSDTGKPIREVFSLLAAVTPFVMMRHLLHWAGGDPEAAVLAAIIMYAAIRYGAAWLLARISVHRGMFHSIPALIIFAELAFLGYKSESNGVKLLMALGVAAGFLSHLLLDELYSVEWSGVRIRLNKSAGSALKLAGKKLLPNAFTYALLFFLSYVVMINIGWIDDQAWEQSSEFMRRAAHDIPTRQ